MESEKKFHNERIKNETESRRLDWIYKSIDADKDFLFELYDEKIHKNVLEIGSFKGENSEKFKYNTNYTGIDISDDAVVYATKNFGSSNRKFINQDANKIDELNEKYDYIFGSGVLHHLKLEQFCAALLKIIEKDGVALFIEPAQGNYLLRIFRKLTPNLRTPDEMPFTENEINILNKYFKLEIKRTAIVRPWLPILFFNNKFIIRKSVEIDSKISKNNLIQKQAWILLIKLIPR
jgi:SAM-dependent methyltransferase